MTGHWTPYGTQPAWPPGSGVVGVVVSRLLRLVNNEI